MSFDVCYYSRPGSSYIEHCEVRFLDGALFSSVPGVGPRIRGANTVLTPCVGTVQVLAVDCSVEQDELLMGLATMLDRGSKHNWLGHFLARWTPFGWSGAGWYDAELVAFFLRVVDLPIKTPHGYSANSLYLAHKRLRS